MNLSNLTAIVHKAKRRLGQGHGSGRVKTAGRGTKGQKSRNKVPLFFEGGSVPLTKRLPFLRGKGRNKPNAPRPFVVNIEQLNTFPKNAKIDIKALADAKLVDEKSARKRGVKILGDGTLSIALIVTVPVSKQAAEKIQKAGGTVQV